MLASASSAMAAAHAGEARQVSRYRPLAWKSSAGSKRRMICCVFGMAKVISAATAIHVHVSMKSVPPPR